MSVFWLRWCRWGRVGGVGGEWVGGLDKGRERWGGVCVRYESGLSV